MGFAAKSDKPDFAALPILQAGFIESIV